MKYPSHLILDIQTKTNLSTPVSFDKLSNLNLIDLYSVSLESKATYIPNLTTLNHTHKEASTFIPLNLFDIHFLRKEKLYTKLKYSRCPQYDIVSGGFAAILAGFIGFLISEKFGIELVDSGDFYNAFMYGVFATFSLRPLIRIYSKDNTPYTPVSPKYLYLFLKDLMVLSLCGAKNIFIKYVPFSF